MANFQRRKCKVFIKIDNNNNIIAVDSDLFINKDNINEWIEIDEGVGDKYALAQSNYFEQPLMNEDGSYNYQYKK